MGTASSASHQKQPQQQQRQGENRTVVARTRNISNNGNLVLPGAYSVPGISGATVGGDSSTIPTDANEGRGGGQGGDNVSSNFTKKKRMILLVIGISVCLVVIISIIVATVISRRGDDDGGGGGSMKQQISILRTKIEQLSITNNVTALYDVASPQYMALLWLASSSSSSSKGDEPLAEEERLQTQFALLVLYYSTNGPIHWYNQHNFLTRSMHECNWSSIGDGISSVGEEATSLQTGGTLPGIGCDSSSLRVTSINLGKCAYGF